MKIAIPTADGKLCPHFGHCEAFALVDVDTEKQEITKQEMVPAPPHQPGLLPRWLAERGAELVIAGGMGARAQAIFAQNGIQVLVGAAPDDLESIVKNYLAGTLTTGENLCDH